MKQTYLENAKTPLKSLRELYALYQFSGKNQASRVAEIAASARSSVAIMEDFSGQKIADKKVLEIGPGQTKPFYYVLGPRNDYTAIDLEIPPERFSVREFVRVFRQNGLLRAAKSLGRHVLGIDRGQARALQAEFGGTPKGQFVQGDAANTAFEADSFDYVMSNSVFEHLPDPSAVMREITRVLKPGGTVLTITHLYTSITGAHDPRVFVDIEAIPAWAHLRPDQQEKVQPNSYLNKVRLADFLAQFDASWPGCTHDVTGGEQERKTELLKQLPDPIRKSYSDQELLADVVITLWKKPQSLA